MCAELSCQCSRYLSHIPTPRALTYRGTGVINTILLRSCSILSFVSTPKDRVCWEQFACSSPLFAFSVSGTVSKPKCVLLSPAASLKHRQDDGPRLQRDRPGTPAKTPFMFLRETRITLDTSCLMEVAMFPDYIILRRSTSFPGDGYRFLFFFFKHSTHSGTVIIKRVV